MFGAAQRGHLVGDVVDHQHRGAAGVEDHRRRAQAQLAAAVGDGAFAAGGGAGAGRLGEHLPGLGQRRLGIVIGQRAAGDADDLLGAGVGHQHAAVLGIDHHHAGRELRDHRVEQPTLSFERGADPAGLALGAAQAQHVAQPPRQPRRRQIDLRQEVRGAGRDAGGAGLLVLPGDAQDRRVERGGAHPRDHLERGLARQVVIEDQAVVALGGEPCDQLAGVGDLVDGRLHPAGGEVATDGLAIDLVVIDDQEAQRLVEGVGTHGSSTRVQ